MRANEAVSRKHAKSLRRTMTRAEALLWTFIRKKALNGARFRRQHPIGPYIADFACVSAKLVVEVDGATHWTEGELAHDRRRTLFMNEKGWRVVRVTNADVYENLNGVWITISAHLNNRDIAPPPLTGEVRAKRGEGACVSSPLRHASHDTSPVNRGGAAPSTSSSADKEGI